MTKKEIFQRLLELGQMADCALMCGDAIWQEDLFKMQDVFNKLVLDIAEDSDVNGTERLVCDFSHTFRRGGRLKDA